MSSPTLRSDLEPFPVVEHEGRPLGIEAEATARPTARDARRLRTLREAHGEAVAGCLPLHAGDDVSRLSEGIVAPPSGRAL